MKSKEFENLDIYISMMKQLLLQAKTRGDIKTYQRIKVFLKNIQNKSLIDNSNINKKRIS